MLDNLNIKGIESNEPVGTRRLKPRGKRRKRFVIEYRMRRGVSDMLARLLWLQDWHPHSRYLTPSRRDQALATLVKKESFFEFRKKPSE